MKEIVSVHVGQAGAQLGAAVWELYSAEHAVDRLGTASREEEEGCRETFFTEASSGKAVPRALFIDLEPTVLDQIRKGSYAKLFHPSQLINSCDDSSGNFARAYYTTGRLMYGQISNEIRRQIEGCDYIRALMIFRALAGGCGSGLTSMLFEIFEEYSKITKIEFPVHPAPHFDSTVVGPYNSILAEHFCLDHCDVGLVFDNEALFDICFKNLDIISPTMTTINRLLAQVCSTLTAATRFHNDLCNDMTLVLTNLVPYPRIHFPLVSYAPLGNVNATEHSENTCMTLTKAVFESENQLVRCDPLSGKYMSCSILYRGLVNPIEVYSTLAEIKRCSRYRFVDWCPTGFKVGIVDQPPLILPQSCFGNTKTSVVMLTNSSAVSTVWQRLAQRFHTLYSKKCFIHWYVCEGLEENEFCEALYNIATLAKDYEEVCVDLKNVTNKVSQIKTKIIEGEGEGIDDPTSSIKTKEVSTVSGSSEVESNESNVDRNSNVNKSKGILNHNKVSNETSKKNKLTYKEHSSEAYEKTNSNEEIYDKKVKKSHNTQNSISSLSSISPQEYGKYTTDQLYSQPWSCISKSSTCNSNNKVRYTKSSKKLPMSFIKELNDEDSIILDKLIEFTSKVYH